MPFDNAEYLPPSVQILLGADRLLAGPGNWLKKRMQDGFGGFCIYGAIRQAAKNTEYKIGSPAYMQAFDSVERLSTAKGFDLQSDFNDAPETTFSDIKALLQEAIELESAKVVA